MEPVEQEPWTLGGGGTSRMTLGVLAGAAAAWRTKLCFEFIISSYTSLPKRPRGGLALLLLMLLHVGVGLFVNKWR